MLSARLVDELTGEPVDVDIEQTTSVDGLFPRIARGGLIGLVGQPARLFPTIATLRKKSCSRRHEAIFVM